MKPRIVRAGEGETKQAPADWFVGTVWQDKVFEPEDPGQDLAQDDLVDLAGGDLDVVANAAVMVPGAVVELYETHAALGQAARQQAVSGE